MSFLHQSPSSLLLSASHAARCVARYGVVSQPAGRARRRVFHAGHVEGGPPAALVMARELEIVALVGHADRDVVDAGPEVLGARSKPRDFGPEKSLEFLRKLLVGKRTRVIVVGQVQVPRHIWVPRNIDAQDPVFVRET